ncbi:MAG: prephenate dehydrogenase dimerization domain-containing protein, partial [Thomasclavelia spiroformis]
IISFTSQLPHALAVALINSDNEKYNTGKYIGDSYRDLTRIANINESLWSELFLKNRDNLLNSIDSFEIQLDLIKQALLDEDESLLKQLFIKSSKRREKL